MKDNTKKILKVILYATATFLIFYVIYYGGVTLTEKLMPEKFEEIRATLEPTDIIESNDSIKNTQIPTSTPEKNIPEETNQKASEDDLFFYTIGSFENSAIVIYKEKRRLELYTDGNHIGTFRIGLGFAPVGHKEIEGDGKTPEGKYYICNKNPNSKFYLSVGISYPNSIDAKIALDNKIITNNEYEKIKKAQDVMGIPLWNTAMGGEIFIHGKGSEKDWTWGCIALDDTDMDIIWEYTKVGTLVTIYS